MLRKLQPTETNSLGYDYIFVDNTQSRKHHYNLQTGENVKILKQDTNNNSSRNQTITINTGFKDCFVRKFANKDIQTPYKIYIYDLPELYNANLLKCASTIGHLEQCGFGPNIYEDFQTEGVIFTNPWQFSLDVILHHKLMFSPYRTLDPYQADVFFIPFYEASHCFCSQYGYNSEKEIMEESLQKEINQLPFYRQGKPHLLPIAKIEKEESSERCPLLRQPWTWNITVIGIEAYDLLRSNSQRLSQLKHPLPHFISAPYPSYVHFTQQNGGKYRETIFQHHRKVFIFMAAGSRRSNPFRNQILDQFAKDSRAYGSMKNYYKSNNISINETLHSVWLITPERDGEHVTATVQWMHNSVFCLQPAGE